MISSTRFGLSAFVLGSALGVSAVAQTAIPATDQAGTTQAKSGMSADETTSYATGKPLEQQSKEGFWGHVNPLARKKWVRRQTDPIRDRTNELDQLQAKNRNDIRDVDTRAQAGIHKANDAAAQADQHALDAGNRATAANALAGNANTKTESLNGTVSNLDQYQTVSSATVAFAAGRTALGTKAKADLDDLATKLAGEKGYLIEVQGYSRSGVATSQSMADSVVRYLVTEHQVPVYRIYKSGLGKATATASSDGEKTLTNGVRVTLLHNSLATMGSTTASTATPKTGVSNPSSNQ